MSIMYRIRLKTQLEPHWSPWFGGMSLTKLESGETELMGAVGSQEALHRLLEKIRDLNIVLISVEQLEDRPEQEGESHGE